MNELQVLAERKVLGKTLTVYGDAENPLFLAKDVADWIEYAKTGTGSYDVSRMLNTLDEEEKLIRKINVSGQNREMWFLTEDGLYETLMQSTKPKAKQFKSEIKRILKEIRKTGGYVNDEEIFVSTYFANADEQTKGFIRSSLVAMKKLNAKIEADKPKVLFAEAVTSCPDSLIVRDFAKLLRQNGIEIGEKRLFAWFRENGYLMKFDNKPTQRSMELGLFDVTEHIIKASAENSFIKLTTKVTAKGQRYFMEKFLKEKKWDE